MKGLITITKDGERRITILSDDTDIKELLQETKDCDYTLVPSCRRSYKVYEKTMALTRYINEIKDMCREPNFKANLTEEQKKTFQGMFDAFEKVDQDLF